MLGDLAVNDAKYVKLGPGSLLAGRRNAELLALMRGGNMSIDRNLIAHQGERRVSPARLERR